jgi:hypothetical protein
MCMMYDVSVTSLKIKKLRDLHFIHKYVKMSLWRKNNYASNISVNEE